MIPPPPAQPSRRSRFAGIGRGRARVVLGVALALMALCALVPAAGPPPAQPASAAAEGGASDLALYQSIVDHVRHGENYYQAAASEMRTGGYPLRPFVTVRPPLLAVVQAALPGPIVAGLLYALVAAVALAWWARVAETFPAVPARIAAGFLLLAGLVTSAHPYLRASHEVWAGLLIALSLALRRRERWVEAVAFATVAMLVRELAALYVLVMLGAAAIEGARREAAGWLLSLGVLALALAAHAWAVAQVVEPGDPASAGWAGMNGVWFFVQTIRHATALEVFPFALAVPIVVGALLGWASWDDPAGGRMTATIVAYALLIAGFARLTNFYWGLIVAPVFLVGLMFLPEALRDLARAALDRRRIVVRRVAR